jgi:ribosomal 50S subunit-associated protein YjgA (DUF615 family)
MSKKEKNINKRERTISGDWRVFGKDSSRKNEIYGNCKVYSPGGNLMFLCVKEKVDWYLDRVDVNTGEPLAREIRHINPILNLLMTILLIRPRGKRIQLMFEPKQEGNAGDKYSLSKKENKCVISGDSNLKTLTKHHITPYCYRKYMPDEYKSANSHDVVPIKDEKHFEYEREADKLKEEIAKKYNAPLDGVAAVDHTLFYAIKAAVAIKYHSEKMPKQTLDFNQERIRKYTGNKEVTQEIIDKLCETDYKEASRAKSHGEIVVSKLIQEGGDAIQEFVEMWREHFIKHAKPKYMPKHWDVKRPASRLEV